MDRVARLIGIATEAGCSRVGVAPTDPFPEVIAEMGRRKATGLSGQLGFTYKDPATAGDVRRSFPWARRLVVATWRYLPASGDPGPSRPNTGRIARFATVDHYRALRAALGRVATELRHAGHRAAVLGDDDRLVDRAAAVRAGVGWWGRSTMVLDPRDGPWLLIGSVVTDAALPVTAPMVRTCGTCTACIPACPTAAIGADGTLDATRCIAYWAQRPGIIPPEIRLAMGDRIYGCDECLVACPPGGRSLAAVPTGGGRVDLLRLLETADAALLEAYGHFYIPRRDPRYLRRNAIVALGNCGDDAAIPVLARWLVHRDWLLRLHAAWALGNLGGAAATTALTTRVGVERHSEVAAEIDLGIASLGPAS